MSGKAGRSGGRNVHHLGLAFASDAEPIHITAADDWPWIFAPAGDWPTTAIFDHLARVLYERGVTTDPLQGDLIRLLSTNHWLRARCLEQIAEHGHGAKLGERDAYTMLRACENSIAAAWRALGVSPWPRREPKPGGGDGEDLDF